MTGYWDRDHRVEGLRKEARNEEDGQREEKQSVEV